MDSKNAAPKLTHAHYFLLVLLLATLVACFKVIQPYVNIIILAMLASILFRPLHEKILKWLKGRQNLSAAVSSLVLTFAVCLPILLMLVGVIAQGVRSFNGIYDWLATGQFEQLTEQPLFKQAEEWVRMIMPDVKKYFPEMELSLAAISKLLLQASSEVGKKLLSQGGAVLGNLTALVMNFFLMIFVFFFVLRDQDSIFAYFLHLSPLSASHERQIMEKVKDVSRSAILGTLVTAAAQGLAGGIAFWIAGLPGLFWGTAMAFASLIPVVGTALIWVPAAIYLFIAGHTGYGIFMIAWSVVVVGSIDNFVRPLFMKGGADMSTLLIFFAILGGIKAFGLIGLLYGPLVFGLAMVLLYIYSLEFGEYLDHQDFS